MTLTHVDGKAIIESQPARYNLNNRPSAQVAEGTVVGSAQELLLEDETTVYRCSHKNAPDCEYTNANLNSITSHQRTHSDRMQAKRAQEQAGQLAAQVAALEEEKERRKRNYSEGSKKGWERKRETAKVVTPSEVGGVGNGTRTERAKGEPSKSVIGDVELARKAQQVIIAYNALQEAHDQFQNVFLGYMRAAQVASEQPAIDPQIVAKAAQYDIIQSALKGIK